MFYDALKILYDSSADMINDFGNIVSDAYNSGVEQYNGVLESLYGVGNSVNDRDYEYNTKYGNSATDNIINGLYKDLPESVGNLASVFGMSDASKNRFSYMFSSLPVIGDFMKASDNYQYMNDYLDNRGMSWSDMKYPTRQSGSGYGSSSLRGSYNFVSDNIKYLYR